MDNQRIKFTLLLLLMVSAVYAETPSYQLLNYPFSNRSAAMGGGRAVDPSGNMDIQGNPANASFVKNIQIQTGYINHVVGIKGYSMGGVMPLERHRLSVETIYFNYGDFNKTSITGVNEGVFSVQELSTSLGYVFQFSESVRLGTRVGVFQQTADARSLSDSYYDLGAIYHKELDSLTIGVFLVSAPLGASAEQFPTQLRVGSSKILSHLPLRLNLEGIYDFENQFRFAVGAEILIHPSFKVRLGINSNRFDLQTGISESDFTAGMSAGFAFDWHGIMIESATQSFGALGWVSQMGVSYHL